MTDLQFWLFLAITIPILFLPVGIAVWKERNVWPVIALSIVFWPAALGLALRTRRLGSLKRLSPPPQGRKRRLNASVLFAERGEIRRDERLRDFDDDNRRGPRSRY